MTAPGPELSSMTATIEDLLRRVTAMAETTAGTDADSLAARPGGARSLSQELFEVERSLGEAMRRLASLEAALRR